MRFAAMTRVTRLFGFVPPENHPPGSKNDRRWNLRCRTSSKGEGGGFVPRIESSRWVNPAKPVIYQWFLIEKGWTTLVKLGKKREFFCFWFVALGDVKIQGHVLGTQFVQQQVDELCFAQLSHSRLLHLRLIHSQGCLNFQVHRPWIYSI